MSSFDSAAYLKRIGLPRFPETTEAGLAQLVEAQLLSIPFENFDILLGRGIDPAPEAVFRRLVTDCRGGYCFQVNQLLSSAVQAAGFSARLLSGRVFFGNPGGVPPRMHLVVLATVDGEAYLTDAAFGGHTPRAPIPLKDGAEMHRAGRTWRLSQDPEFGWRLQDHTAEGWRDLYVFDLNPVYPSDIVAGNHFTSTFPESPFV